MSALLYFLLIIGIFLVLSLVGGATNTRYKVRGVGTIEPMKISKGAIQENINIAKSSIQKIGAKSYDKILIDIRTFLKKEKGISIQFARLYLFYGKIMYARKGHFFSIDEFRENLAVAMSKAKERNEEEFYREVVLKGVSGHK